MIPRQFWVICVLHTVLLFLLLTKFNQIRSQELPEGINCEDVQTREYSEEFYMKMGLCRRNISVACLTRPNHACFRNQTNFKATAVVNGHIGHCLIEANLTDYRTLRFLIEAKRIKNPNQEGSRSLGGDVEEHQRGKCILKYTCHKKAPHRISVDCGSVFVNEMGGLFNYTRQRAYWTAPPNFNDSVYFTSTISVAPDLLNLDISSAKVHNIPVVEQEEEDTTSNPVRPLRKKVKRKNVQSFEAQNTTMDSE